MSSTSSDDSDSYDSTDDTHWCMYYSSTDRSTGSDEESDVISYPFPFPLKTKVKESIPREVADLKDIASVNVAIALWKHVNIPQAIKDSTSSRCNAKNSNIESIIYKEVLKSTKALHTPKSITKMIVTCVDKMRNDIKDWVSYNFRRVFFDHKSDHFVYNHINYMVFYSNGTINSKETARNLFRNSPRLSEIEKYYLLCTYCLKEDLERLSPSVSTYIDVNQCTFEDHPLIYYWNCFFRNELDKIAIPGTETIDTFMIKNRNVDNWPAKEYFLDHLGFDEQVRMAVWLIDKHDIKYLQLLLMKLDDHQRFHLLAIRAMKIISMLICTEAIESNCLDTFSMWFEIRDMISKKQFSMIFNLSLNVGAYCVLELIWSSASDEFRDFVLASNECTIGGILRRWTADPEKVLFYCVFFRIIMQYANADFKNNISEKRFFVEACEELIRGDKLKYLDRFLKSSLTYDEKIRKFKREFVGRESFGKYCEKLMSTDKHEMLQELLNSFFTNDEELVEFRRNLEMNLVANEIKDLNV